MPSLTPVEGDGLQAGPALTRPNLELFIEAAASDSIPPVTTEYQAGGSLSNPGKSGRREAFLHEDSTSGGT